MIHGLIRPRCLQQQLCGFQWRDMKAVCFCEAPFLGTRPGCQCQEEEGKEFDFHAGKIIECLFVAKEGAAENIRSSSSHFVWWEYWQPTLLFTLWSSRRGEKVSCYSYVLRNCEREMSPWKNNNIPCCAFAKKKWEYISCLFFFASFSVFFKEKSAKKNFLSPHFLVAWLGAWDLSDEWFFFSSFFFLWCW